MKSNEILSIKDLSLSFIGSNGLNPVLNNVSFSVRKGERLAVVGESGSGKTVTVKRVLHLLSKVIHTSGTIHFRNKKGDILDITHNNPEQMLSIRGNEIAMIFQEPMTSLNPTFTIGNQIEESIRIHQNLSRSEAREAVIQLLELVRIPDAESRVKQHPHQMSGGMRQRVMIAMAMACKPQILIADEPTTALDVTIQAQILSLISSLQETLGMSVIFITHDMNVVGDFADRVAVMYKGEVVEENDTVSLFSAPSHPYTRALLKSLPKLGSMKNVHFPMTFPVLKMEEMTADSMNPSLRPTLVDGVVYDTEPVLKVKNLTARFVNRKNLWGIPTHNVHAVEKVSFDLYRGETLSIVGESGCGKTTTAYAVAALVPAQGSAVFEGKDILALAPRDFHQIRQNIQIIFQDPYSSLNPRRSIGASIEEPLIISGSLTKPERRERIVQLLEKVGLDSSCVSRFPHEFSGGQRQRIAIARAIAANPKIIIADEAVSSLDVSIRANILNIMMELQKEMDLAFIFISHDMAVVERISHRAAVMYLGQIVEIGSRRDIFENPHHHYTKKLLDAVPKGYPGKPALYIPAADEIPSPVYEAGTSPLPLEYDEVDAGHLVARDMQN